MKKKRYRSNKIYLIKISTYLRTYVRTYVRVFEKEREGERETVFGMHLVLKLLPSGSCTLTHTVRPNSFF